MAKPNKRKFSGPSFVSVVITALGTLVAYLTNVVQGTQVNTQGAVATSGHGTPTNTPDEFQQRFNTLIEHFKICPEPNLSATVLNIWASENPFESAKEFGADGKQRVQVLSQAEYQKYDAPNGYLNVVSERRVSTTLFHPQDDKFRVMIQGNLRDVQKPIALSLEQDRDGMMAPSGSTKQSNKGGTIVCVLDTSKPEEECCHAFPPKKSAAKRR